MTATINKNGMIEVLAGCYFGSLADFKKRVKNVHGKNEFAKEYFSAIELIQLKLDRVKSEVEKACAKSNAI